MIGFERKIESLELIVYKEDCLYTKNSQIFKSILATFVQVGKPSFFHDSLYIYSKGCYIFKNKISDYTIKCDTTEKNWVFKLINLFEYWCAQKMNCTVLHGCFVKYDNLNLLLLGKRKSGKSTMLKYFLDFEYSKYLDEDCVYLVNRKFYGFCLPVSMRSDMSPNNVERICTFDDENSYRYLYCYSSLKHITCSEKIDFIVFPEYFLAQENIQVNKILPTSTFELLLNNVRNSKNVYELYKDLREIAKTVPAYKMVYNNSQHVVDFFKNIRLEYINEKNS